MKFVMGLDDNDVLYIAKEEEKESLEGIVKEIKEVNQSNLRFLRREGVDSFRCKTPKKEHTSDGTLTLSEDSETFQKGAEQIINYIVQKSNNLSLID